MRPLGQGGGGASRGRASDYQFLSTVESADAAALKAAIISRDMDRLAEALAEEDAPRGPELDLFEPGTAASPRSHAYPLGPSC